MIEESRLLDGKHEKRRELVPSTSDAVCEDVYRLDDGVNRDESSRLNNR